MKKSLLALVALSAFTSTAHSQSNVTLYGIADSGITYTNNQNGHSAWQATSGNVQGARFGLLGMEDLGGGNQAVFRLENGFNIESGALGQGGRMFGRQAYVGFANSTYGTFTMGRQYNPMQDFVAPLAVAGSLSLTQYGLHPLDNDNINNTYRTNNTVKYTSPNLAGFQAGALYGFSNSTNFADNRSWSIGASYAHGPLQVAAAYVRLSNPALNTTGAIASDNYYSPAYLKSATSVQMWGAGANYAIGHATFGLLYTGSLFGNTTGSLFQGTANGSLRFNNYEGGFRYAFTPALNFALGETYTQVSQNSESGHYLQTSVGMQYFLSKRTDLYANLVYQTTSNNLHAWIQGVGSASSTTAQVVGIVGMRHRF
ncbi:porin [Burkholderia sp. SRS-W-2-2016]|uniref:porin n=1 Tax=Burkholderia sp. SRS-W-2-2016 TaxID=1926878 RepID=UPI0009FB4A86|nr:porin [Burkholderia sp. SRS-W-2-2016]